MNRNDLRRVDMNLLVLFEALMIERNLTRVGEKLFITQSTVSAALARLRELFDDPLLIRNGRAMEPTPRAMQIFAELGPAMDVISAAISRAREFDPVNSCNVFRLGLSDDAEFGLFPALLQAHRHGSLPAGARIIGVARDALDDAQYRAWFASTGRLDGNSGHRYSYTFWSYRGWRQADSALKFALLRARRSVRKLAIRSGLHKPYNW